MNYRHAFHAGNFADVFKHAVLARIIVHLIAKPQAFRVVDTHAGAGLYDLTAEEAARTGEWREGIGRLLGAAIDMTSRELLAPYLDAIAALNPDGLLPHGRSPSRAVPDGLVRYPGSPLLALALMRPQDRLVACELEPAAAAALAAHLKRDRRAKAVAIDGWIGLNAYIPPRERRGLVLVDPPFEDHGDFARLGREFARAWRKWPTGIYVLWYPIKDRTGPDALADALEEAGVPKTAPKILRCEIAVGAAGEPDDGRLQRCGLVIVNPPWRLAEELEHLLPCLATALSGGRGNARIDWIAGEKVEPRQ